MVMLQVCHCISLSRRSSRRNFRRGIMRTMNRRWRLGSATIVAGLLAVSWLAAAAPASDERPVSGGEVLNFALIDHHGRLQELRRLGGKAVVLFFTANDCPVARQSAARIKSLRDKFAERGVSVFMVNSSLADNLTSISMEAQELRTWYVPVLKDDTQGVARHLGVSRTGETIAISTADWKIFYRG